MAGDPTHRDRATDLGVVRINNDAITTIASIAAMEVKGVHKMGSGLRKAFCDILCMKPSFRGVKIEMKDSEIKLIVSVVVEYGVNIPRVADEVQDNVKRAVEKMTGLIMSEVDVVIEGVHASAVSDKRI